MKLIFTSKQIPEISRLPWKERRAIIRRHHWAFFKHWQGWLGFAAYATGLILGVMTPELIIPETLPTPTRLIFQATIIVFFAAIYLVMYYNTLRPHIRKELEFWMGKGFLDQREDKHSEPEPGEGRETSSRPSG
jgi:hypothetical protein